MSNLMSSNRDEGRSFKNVEHFGRSLSDVIETADLSNDTPADVFTNSRSSMKSLDVDGHNILSNKLYGENVCEPKIQFSFTVLPISIFTKTQIWI